MATKLIFDSVEDTATDESAAAPRETRAPLRTVPSDEPERQSYPGYVKAGILFGGAIACWAVVAGVISLL